MNYMAGIRVFQAATARALAGRLIPALAQVGADPFEQAYLVVPGAGMRRWLSQEIARSDAQICAGVVFASFSELESCAGPRLTRRRLVFAMKAALDSAPELAELRDRLGTASEPVTALNKVAGHFLNYLRYRPAMLLAWEAGDDITADGRRLGEQSWQASLWRAMQPGLLEEASAAELPDSFAIFCPNAWSPRDNALITSLAADHQIDIYQLFAMPGWLSSDGRLTDDDDGAESAPLGGGAAHVIEKRPA
ncbi:MAG: exodeoxyribonuclease V subunit gamma, partial [Propionibacteriaceae bacterium]|nr:exodeoxyribonuclease V subunit gamma [Propionibacteriaceae bacterium]